MCVEKSIVHYIGFTIPALHNPVALRHVAETGVGGSRFGVFALRGVYEEGSKRTECTH
jgi:hypothetical protein